MVVVTRQADFGARGAKAPPMLFDKLAESAASKAAIAAREGGGIKVNRPATDTGRLTFFAGERLDATRVSHQAQLVLRKRFAWRKRRWPIARSRSAGKASWRKLAIFELRAAQWP